MPTTESTKCLLAGNPGVGKTTLLTRVGELLAGVSVGGFFTRELRKGGSRVGFGIETFDGQAGVLAHIDYRTGPHVGKYGVDVAAFERIGVAAIERAVSEADIILIDEIGKMELYSQRFTQAVTRALASGKPMLATVMLRPNPFADSLKARPDTELIVVTPQNRDTLVDQLVERLAG